VDLKNADAPVEVGARNDDAAVETARALERRVEHVRAVGGGDEDDALVALEAVHLHQQLVEGLLALVVAASEARSTGPADGVDPGDEDEAGSVLLPLLEEVTAPAGADAHDHLHEARAADAEKGTARLARHRLRQERLARARGAHHQHPLGDAAAELGE